MDQSEDGPAVRDVTTTLSRRGRPGDTPRVGETKRNALTLGACVASSWPCTPRRLLVREGGLGQQFIPWSGVRDHTSHFIASLPSLCSAHAGMLVGGRSLGPAPGVHPLVTQTARFPTTGARACLGPAGMDIAKKTGTNDTTSPMPSFNERVWRNHLEAGESSSSLALTSREWGRGGGLRFWLLPSWTGRGR